MMKKVKLSAITIDDDELSTLLIGKIVEKTNTVEMIGCHNNPVTGLSSIIMDKPDLLFLDMDMPFLSGLEILRILEVLDHTPMIIVISGKDGFEEEIKDRNVFAFFKKPVDQVAMIKMMNSLS